MNKEKSEHENDSDSDSNSDSDSENDICSFTLYLQIHKWLDGSIPASP